MTTPLAARAGPPSSRSTLSAGGMHRLPYRDPLRRLGDRATLYIHDLNLPRLHNDLFALVPSPFHRFLLRI